MVSGTCSPLVSSTDGHKINIYIATLRNLLTQEYQYICGKDIEDDMNKDCLS